MRVLCRIDRFYLLLIVGLASCYPVCNLLPPFVNRFPYDSVPPPLPIPLDTTHNGCLVLPTQCRLILVPPDHEAAASRTPRYHVPAFLAATSVLPVLIVYTWYKS